MIISRKGGCAMGIMNAPMMLAASSGDGARADSAEIFRA